MAEGVLADGERILRLSTIIGYVVFCIWAYVAAFVGWAAVEGWVYRHETLATGLLALSSALIGAYFLYQQTHQLERHELERQQRRREAVRTVLPVALSTISRYAVASARATKVLLDQCVDENLPERNALILPELPTLPTEAISTIKEMAEAISANEVRPFAILVADIQVQASRLAETIASAGDQERLTVKANLEEYVLDCGMIYARAGSFFPFGRRTTDTVPESIRWHDVQSALYFFDIVGGQYDRIFETIVRRSGGDLWSIVSDRWTAVG